MDFMKILDQTVREIKREVNIKLLKVPEIEQKVLDATSNEPWGPHGSALAEIAQATKKFSECQLIMNVLWTRLTHSGRNWLHVYKALAVIEFLVAHGSERAVDDIIEHSLEISALSRFEYVEPNGKDMGISIRKRAETILTLLNDNDKIQAVRDKAATNRDKYFGLSSTGITYKSSSAPQRSSRFLPSDRFGGLSGTKEGEMFKDSYKDRERFEEDEFGKNNHDKSRGGVASKNEGNNLKNESALYGRDHDALPSNTSSRSFSKSYQSDDTTSQSFAAPSDTEDDFDPRGTSIAKKAPQREVDLFGDLMDAPISPPPKMSTFSGNDFAEVDLFADVTFVSAIRPHVEAGVSSQIQANVDLFASPPASHSASSETVEFFAAPGPFLEAESRTLEAEPNSSQSVDSLAGVSLDGFDGSVLFGAFTSHNGQVSAEPSQNSVEESSLENLNQNTSTESKLLPKKDHFQVKSGIWADTLSRGLIDLNITASKKTNLADIGVVGGRGNGTDEKEKGLPTSAYMGRAMVSGSDSHGGSGFTSTGVKGDIFSTITQQHNHQQFGSFKN